MSAYRPRLPEIVAMLDAMPADIETLTLTYEREKLLAAIATEKQKRLTAERTANDRQCRHRLAGR